MQQQCVLWSGEVPSRDRLREACALWSGSDRAEDGGLLLPYEWVRGHAVKPDVPKQRKLDAGTVAVPLDALQRCEA